MATFKKVSRFADRGKKAEEAVQKALTCWESNLMAQGRARCDWARLMDTKAAGRIVKAAPADFEWFFSGAHVRHGLIEVKQTEHTYRLERDKLPQLARLRRRAAAGGHCLVVIMHSETGAWRCVDTDWLMQPNDKGSWDLRGVPEWPTALATLASVEAAFG